MRLVVFLIVILLGGCAAHSTQEKGNLTPLLIAVDKLTPQIDLLFRIFPDPSVRSDLVRWRSSPIKINVAMTYEVERLTARRERASPLSDCQTDPCVVMLVNPKYFSRLSDLEKYSEIYREYQQLKKLLEQ
ncbi:MAG TPA: hypothetical protein VF974_08380 [Patescibacteria group bacterium]